MPRFSAYWPLPAFFLVACSATRAVTPLKAPIRREDNIIILKHVGHQTFSVPVLVLLPDADTLQDEIPNHYLVRLPRLAFDSACAYYNARLPVLLNQADCQCPYDGEFGAYKVTVKHQGFVTVHFLNCRDCTHATFTAIAHEPPGPSTAPQQVRRTAGGIVNITSSHP